MADHFAVKLKLFSDGDCAVKFKLFPVLTVQACCYVILAVMQPSVFHIVYRFYWN